MRHRTTLEAIAQKYGISTTLLQTTLVHEGSGRQAFAERLLLFRYLEILQPLGGRPRTIGVGQMRPDVAVATAEKYLDVKMAEQEARFLLALNDRFAVEMTAAYLHELQSRFELRDRETFVAYAFRPQTIARLKAHHFGALPCRWGECLPYEITQHALARTRRYDELLVSIGR